MLLLAALTVALALPPLSSTAVTADSSALRNAVTVAGIMQHEQALQAIANQNGGTRASGTSGFDASLAYVKGELEATGYYDVTVQPFLFDVFRELATPIFQR